jgi:hypothetical protein
VCTDVDGDDPMQPEVAVDPAAPTADPATTDPAANDGFGAAPADPLSVPSDPFADQGAIPPGPDTNGGPVTSPPIDNFDPSMI